MRTLWRRAFWWSIFKTSICAKLASYLLWNLYKLPNAWTYKCFNWQMVQFLAPKINNMLILFRQLIECLLSAVHLLYLIFCPNWRERCFFCGKIFKAPLKNGFPWEWSAWKNLPKKKNNSQIIILITVVNILSIHPISIVSSVGNFVQQCHGIIWGWHKFPADVICLLTRDFRQHSLACGHSELML